MNGHSSSLCDTSCGVPQESFLALIYFNDLLNSSEFFSFFLFADDTNIYCESDDLKLLTRKVDKELKSKIRLDSNKLALNIGKTNFLMFHFPKRN